MVQLVVMIVFLLSLFFPNIYGDCSDFDWYLSSPAEQEKYMVDCVPSYVSIFLNDANSGDKKPDPVVPGPNPNPAPPPSTVEVDGISYVVNQAMPDNPYKSILNIKYPDVSIITTQMLNDMRSALLLASPRDMTVDEATEYGDLGLNGDKTTYEYKLYITIKT